MQNTSLITVFLTGLITGGLTCLAVQGGLLASSIAQREGVEEENRYKQELQKRNKALPIISFLAAKLIAYTILGFLLGSLGSVVQLSLTAKIIMQMLVALFMIGTAANILNVHPIFRYFVIQPPKFLTRIVRRRSKSADLFAPFILGAFTVFIPCGTTQAMMALSIASGSAVMGAAILGAFVLGTSPLFFVLGYFASRLSDVLHARFMKVAAAFLMVLAFFNLNNALALTGADFSPKAVWCSVFNCSNQNDNSGIAAVGNKVEIVINSKGYSPSNIKVTSGSKITLDIKNTDGFGCQQAFTLPTLGIEEVVYPGESKKVEFFAQTPGEIPFMCSMGMFRGVIKVI